MWLTRQAGAHRVYKGASLKRVYMQSYYSALGLGVRYGIEKVGTVFVRLGEAEILKEGYSLRGEALKIRNMI